MPCGLMVPPPVTMADLFDVVWVHAGVNVWVLPHYKVSGSTSPYAENCNPVKDYNNFWIILNDQNYMLSSLSSLLLSSFSFVIISLLGWLLININIAISLIIISSYSSNVKLFS